MSYIIDKFKKIFNFFLEIIYPNKCISCKKIISNGYFCLECWKKLRFISEPYCKVCGRPFCNSNHYGLICVDCLHTKHYYNRSLSVFVYNKTIAKSIFDFKFYRRTFLSKIFAKFLLIKYREISKNNIINNIDVKINNNNIDYIIPVPMHIKKLRQRRFNQSLLIVKDFSKLVNIPYIQDLLIKQKNTVQQVKLNLKKRKTNLRSAFKLNEKYKSKILNKNILIIDDVFTTGTTVNECAKILKHHKVNKVFVLTLARGGLRNMPNI